MKRLILVGGLILSSCAVDEVGSPSDEVSSPSNGPIVVAPDQAIGLTDLPQMTVSSSPICQRDENWSDQGCPVDVSCLHNRRSIVAEIGQLDVNVIFAKYSGDKNTLHFVTNTKEDFLVVWQASVDVDGPLVLSVLENTRTCTNNCDVSTPMSAGWAYSNMRDIAPVTTAALSWIDHLVGLIARTPGAVSKWAKIYDRSGKSRYAIMIADGASDRLPAGSDSSYAKALHEIASHVKYTHPGLAVDFDIGFVLAPHLATSASGYSIIRPDDSLADLLACASCLAAAHLL
jgi:hypothetical protein